MKYTGRTTALFVILITQCIRIIYYFYRDGYMDQLEYIGFPFMLILAWLGG